MRNRALAFIFDHISLSKTFVLCSLLFNITLSQGLLLLLSMCQKDQYPIHGITATRKPCQHSNKLQKFPINAQLNFKFVAFR